MDIDDMTGRDGNVPPGFSYVSNPGDVVLLHGFLGPPWTMRFMARRLRRDGYRCWCPWYESWAQGFDSIVMRIATRMEARGIGTTEGTKGPVHFIGHSMGGLIARSVAARLDPALTGRVVMLGTPNAGSEYADFCTRNRLLRPVLGRAGPALVTQRRLPALDDLGPPAFPIGVIAGDRPFPTPLRIMPLPHDGKVSVASTHFPGEADHIILPVSHAAMPFDRTVQRQAALFLKHGRFIRP